MIKEQKLVNKLKKKKPKRSKVTNENEQKMFFYFNLVY